MKAIHCTIQMFVVLIVEISSRFGVAMKATKMVIETRTGGPRSLANRAKMTHRVEEVCRYSER